MLTPRKKKKAHEFATLLNDLKSLAYFEWAFNKYPEKYLEEILVRVMQIPDEKIKVSRGALFNKLVAKRPAKWDYNEMMYEQNRSDETEKNSWN